MRGSILTPLYLTWVPRVHRRGTVAPASRGAGVDGGGNMTAVFTRDHGAARWLAVGSRLVRRCLPISADGDRIGFSRCCRCFQAAGRPAPSVARSEPGVARRRSISFAKPQASGGAARRSQTQREPPFWRRVREDPRLGPGAP